MFFWFLRKSLGLFSHEEAQQAFWLISSLGFCLCCRSSCYFQLYSIPHFCFSLVFDAALNRGLHYISLLIQECLFELVLAEGDYLLNSLDDYNTSNTIVFQANFGGQLRGHFWSHFWGRIWGCKQPCLQM